MPKRIARPSGNLPLLHELLEHPFLSGKSRDRLLATPLDLSCRLKSVQFDEYLTSKCSAQGECHLIGR